MSEMKSLSIVLFFTGRKEWYSNTDVISVEKGLIMTSHSVRKMIRLLKDTILYDINSSGFFVAACSVVCTFVDLYIIVEKNTSENSCLSHTIKVENVETVGSFYQNLS